MANISAKVSRTSTDGSIFLDPNSNAGWLDFDSAVRDQPVQGFKHGLQRGVARCVADGTAGFVDAGIGAVGDVVVSRLRFAGADGGQRIRCRP